MLSSVKIKENLRLKLPPVFLAYAFVNFIGERVGYKVLWRFGQIPQNYKVTKF